MKKTIKFVAACAVSMGAMASFAHVTLLDQAAAAGVDYRGVLRVGHGCEGAATTAIKVTLPAGFNGAQPMVKLGWTVATKTGALAEPYEMHGKKFTEGVLEITWTVNNVADALPDSLYDEFVLHGTTPKKPGTIWFKVEQNCTKGANNWVEIPEAGKDAHSLKFPAAKLEVLDIQSAGGHSH
jgi:periplasmic copper chaperone A